MLLVLAYLILQSVTYIIRQSSMNRATDLYQGQLFDWEKQENRNKLITLAREIEKYVHNG